MTKRLLPVPVAGVVAASAARFGVERRRATGRAEEVRPGRSGALPAVKTICSSAHIRSTSCGWISGRAASCFDRVRDEPDACYDRLTWSISTVVVPQRFEM